MNFYDKLKKVEHISNAGYWTRRIGAELQYMANLSASEGNIYDDRIEQALDYLIEAYDGSEAVTKADVLKAEEMLSDLSEKAKAYTVICVAHAHIDMNWQWGIHETVSVTVDTFRTMLNLMREYPEFTYGQSQASTYHIIEKYAPDMLDEIKKYIREGRWEVIASQWVETDKNMPNGESLSRHILYTKRYLSKLLDIDPDTLNLDFEPDTFGHNANVPEILQNGGVDYYYHCRGYDGYNIYRWQSPSGKEVLAYREPKWYLGDVNQFSFRDIPLFCKKHGISKYLEVYGVGDHGGGPTRRDIEQIIDFKNYPLYPTVKFGSYAEFYAELEAHRSEFPIVKKELNFVFTGCYTSQSQIKLANRVCEDRLQEAEFLSAAAAALAGAKSDPFRYEEAWRRVLFNHFHDILPGSGVRETRQYAVGLGQETLSYANTGANLAMRALTDAINTDNIEFDNENHSASEGAGVGFTQAFPVTERGRGKIRVMNLFNTTMYDRAEPVEVTIWDYPYDLGRVKVTSSNGKEVPFQFTSHGSHYWGHTYIKLLIDAEIPAFGYSTYIVSQRPYDSGYRFNSWDDPREDRGLGDIPIILENEFIRAEFCPLTMALKSLTDKETGDKLIDEPSCIFRFIRENPKYGMTSWRVGPYMSVSDLNSGDYTVRITEYQHQPLRQYVRFEIRFASSFINVAVILTKGKRLLEFDTSLDWKEVGGDNIPQLNFFVPASYKIDKFNYNIPFGTVERDPVEHDVPANSYMEMINNNGRSLFIVTDSKYGYRGHQNAGAVTLIRSSTEPDPYPEFGKFHVKIGVGIGNKCEIEPQAESFCHPIAFASNTKHSGKLPLDGQLLSVEGNAKLYNVKTAEDGGYILRLSTISPRTEAVTVNLNIPVTSASLVDISERHELGKCEIAANKVMLNIEPYSMVSVKIN